MKAVFDKQGNFKSLFSDMASSSHTVVVPVFASDDTVVDITDEETIAGLMSGKIKKLTRDMLK